MSLENLVGTSKYISDLIPTNPVGAADAKSQGDDHIRGIKNVLLNTFPGLTGAVTATQAELNSLDGVTALIQSMLLKATEAEVLTLLGISAYIQTLLNDADAATARTTLGLGTAAVEDVGAAIGDALQVVDVGGSAGLPAIDGSQLTGIVVFEDSTAGSYVVAAADSVYNSAAPPPASYTKVKEVKLGRAAGTFTISFALAGYTEVSFQTVYGRVYKNGVAVGTERTFALTPYAPASYTTYSENIAFAGGDLVQLYVKCTSGVFPVYAKEFRVKETSPVSPVVVLD